MRILTVDVGTGTQDIYLYNSELHIENGYKLVVPSPTMMFHRRIRRATKLGRPVALTGVLMGGGPVTWAARDHVRAGYTLYATPEAACTFDDDLEAVQERMGIILVSQDEALSLGDDVERLALRDFDYGAIAAAFEQFGYELTPDLVAVAVFDHGDAPKGVSDRQFRFDYLSERLKVHNRLSTFAFRGDDVPPIMTRLQAVVESAQGVDLPLMVMDTAPAAVLGAMLDPRVAERDRVMVANVGNFHCLAFRLRGGVVEGVFEHHTGEVDADRLDQLVGALAQASLTHQDVFGDKGHGALMLDNRPMALPTDRWGVAVTGPRRSLMRNSAHRAYMAVPYGDMMLAGCFGMLAALPQIYPEYADPLLESLKGGIGRPPWEGG